MPLEHDDLNTIRGLIKAESESTRTILGEQFSKTIDERETKTLETAKNKFVSLEGFDVFLSDTIKKSTPEQKSVLREMFSFLFD